MILGRTYVLNPHFVPYLPLYLRQKWLTWRSQNGRKVVCYSQSSPTLQRAKTNIATEKIWSAGNEREWLAENIWAALKQRSPTGQSRNLSICFRFKRKIQAKVWQLRRECTMMMRSCHAWPCERTIEHELVCKLPLARRCRRAVLLSLESYLPVFL